MAGPIAAQQAKERIKSSRPFLNHKSEFKTNLVNLAKPCLKIKDKKVWSQEMHCSDSMYRALSIGGGMDTPMGHSTNVL